MTELNVIERTLLNVSGQMYEIEVTNFYCMQCGKRTVVGIPKIWEDNAGYQHYCITCGYGVMHTEGEYNQVDSRLKEVIQNTKFNFV